MHTIEAATLAELLEQVNRQMFPGGGQFDLAVEQVHDPVQTPEGLVVLIEYSGGTGHWNMMSDGSRHIRERKILVAERADAPPDRRFVLAKVLSDEATDRKV